MIEILQVSAPSLIAMLVLMAASAFFSASETALFYLSRDELRKFRLGKPRERAAAALMQNPDRLLTAILFWNLSINLAYFAVSVVVIHRLTAAGHHGAAGLFGVASLLLIIVVGEVLPKGLAVAWRRTVAAAVGWPLATAVRMLDPVSGPLRGFTRVLRRTFWPHVKSEPYLLADDLERAVEASHLSEELIQQERQVLHSILDLSEILVEEVMRPRGSFVTLNPPVSLTDLAGTVPDGAYIVVPANEATETDRAIPLAGLTAIPETHVEHVAEEVVYVPWCATLAATLQMMRSQVKGLAVVINEYGDTIGVVTYEDILDTILMPTSSRAGRLLRREPILKIGPNRYHVEGLTTLRFLARQLNVPHEPTADDQVTVAGLLQDELERIPEVGDECRWRDYRIKVIEVFNRGRLRVMVSKEAETPNGADVH